MLLPSMVLTLALAAPVQARTAPGPSAEPSIHDVLIRHGDEAHAALDPLGALALYERVLRDDSTSYDALWRAAREAVNLGMLEPEDEERRRWAERAVTYARRAREILPDAAEGAEWLAIGLGRLALEHGPRSRAEMAVEIREAALTALSLDSLRAGAHHVLGEWHAEIRRLSGLERWAARALLGADELGEASWDRAVEHLERAVALEPGGIVHRLDLARTYLDLDRKEDARRQLEELLARPAREPVDPLHKEAARRLLERM